MAISKSQFSKRISQEKVRYEKDVSSSVRFGATPHKDHRDPTGDNGYWIGIGHWMSKPGTPALRSSRPRDTS